MRKSLFIISLLGLYIHTANAQSMGYLTKVLEYCPAPGQFIHELPAYTDGDDADTMAQKCLDNLYNDGLVCLGAYGGYITVSFDHRVLNISGEKDLLIYGNANKWNTSAEPGIVMVSVDTNGDGLPNDEWYELAGSEYGKPTTIQNYEITYTRPLRDDMDVSWKDNQGNTGKVKYMGVVQGSYNHAHAHYPKWVASNTLTFKGARLPDNGVYDEEDGIWKMKPFEYGYADNLNYLDEDGCRFDLDWAVNSLGEKVKLTGIDFVRIYTAVNQQIENGVGEISTEISDVQDLHPNATSINKNTINAIIYYKEGALNIENENSCEVCIYNLQGVLLKKWKHEGGSIGTPLRMQKGTYIVQIATSKKKVIID